MEDGEDDTDAMQLLNMAMMCRAFRVLPRPGGLLEQDAWFVEVLQNVESAMLEREKSEQIKAQRNNNAGRYGR